MNNKMNMNMLLNMLSKMDKKDLEKGIEQANKILSSKNKDEILKGLQNNNKRDNRKANLREVTESQNQMNKGLRSNNTSGVTGVYWDKESSRWFAVITANKNVIFLGYFNSFDNAVRARKQAEEKYHGEYSYDNSMKAGA